jgi:hypothetical protein
MKKTLPILISVTLVLFSLFMLPRAPARADLPPRPTVGALPDGATIELRVTGATAPFWTEVQWRDHAGAWHTVDGWQGIVQPGRKLAWWVGVENLGAGPFRWLVYDAAGGSLLAISDPFDLPAKPKQNVVVDVAIEP